MSHIIYSSRINSKIGEISRIESFKNPVKDLAVAALMKLARPAPLSKVVRTICLPGPGQDLSGGHCVTSGWGRYGPSPSLSTALLEASVPLLNLEECLQAYGTSVPIRKGHLCAGQIDGSSGSCVVNPYKRYDVPGIIRILLNIKSENIIQYFYYFNIIY